MIKIYISYSKFFNKYLVTKENNGVIDGRFNFETNEKTTPADIMETLKKAGFSDNEILIRSLKQ